MNDALYAELRTLMSKHAVGQKPIDRQQQIVWMQRKIVAADVQRMNKRKKRGNAEK